MQCRYRVVSFTRWDVKQNFSKEKNSAIVNSGEAIFLLHFSLTCAPSTIDSLLTLAITVSLPLSRSFIPFISRLPRDTTRPIIAVTVLSFVFLHFASVTGRRELKGGAELCHTVASPSPLLPLSSLESIDTRFHPLTHNLLFPKSRSSMDRQLV